MSTTPEQLTLDLEMPTYDHYLVELRCADETLRSNRAIDVDGALSLIDGFRELAENRNQVTWQGDEVDYKGALYGLAPGGVMWEVHVTPALTQELTK